ncbi:MAG: GDSL-type esterase/lipase family protein, partial [Acidobacteriota bacterium]|nr:GDSL-type esterase/lipase family protein [Acidobacteriota bacterium]
HNDMKESWPQTYAEASTTYKAYLRVLIAEARRRGATPILITPMHRRNFDANARIVNTLGDYPDAMRQTAKEEAVPLIDLNAMSAVFYEALGPLRAPVAFAAGGRDSTHHSAYGAYELAKCVVQGIRDSKLELAAYLAPDVQPFDPAHPDPIPASYRFDFSSGAAALGFTKVLPGTVYTDDRGYGFEPVTSEKPPFYFSVKVPEEGNYRVTVQLGDRAAESVTTVKAELRRLMLERVHTAPGRVETRSFIVNTRRPQIAGGGEVRLKDREKTSEGWAWDDRITLEFTDTHPAVGSVEIEKADGIPTLYIAGDSTSTDQSREPFNSWGQMLTRFFKPEIAVANHGESGESLKSYIGEKRLAKVMSVIKPGDWLFIQMGHNDQKLTGAGVGAFTTYKAALKQFIAEARQHGATPVLITPMHRLTFDSNGKIVNSLGDYPEAVRQTAKEENVAMIDLNAMSKSFYEALGPEQGHLAFAGQDTTHHSDYGSYELAKCIVQGIKDARLPLMKYLVEMPVFDPAHPDPVEKFDVPAEPLGAVEKPYGR